MKFFSEWLLPVIFLLCLVCGHAQSVSLYVDGVAGSDAHENDCSSASSPCATMDHVFSVAAILHQAAEIVEINVAGMDNAYSVSKTMDISPSTLSFTVQHWNVRGSSSIWSVNVSGDTAVFIIDSAVHSKLKKFEIRGPFALSVRRQEQNRLAGIVRISGQMPQLQLSITNVNIIGCSTPCVSLRRASVAEMIVRNVMLFEGRGPAIDLELTGSHTMVTIEDVYFH